MQQAFRLVLATVVVAGIGGPFAAAQPVDGSNDEQPGRRPEAVLVVVNGEPITVGDLEFFVLSRRVQKESRAKLRNQLLTQLIDRRLMRAYLAKRNATPDARAIDAQVKRIQQLIRKQGDDPATVLRKLGFDEARLRAEIALPEEDIARIEKGQKVELKVRALPFEVFYTEVDRVAPKAVSGELQSTVVVYCKPHDSTRHLRPGMTGYARIYRGRSSAASVFAKKGMRVLRTEFWW